MTLNIPNLDRLISYLEKLPPEEFSMKYVKKIAHPCGTACCLAGHQILLFGSGNALNIPSEHFDRFIMPNGWQNEEDGNKAYPLSRAFRMLRHLRAEFIRTGTVVVDWDAPEAAETQRKPWSPPVVIGADKALPSSLTSLLREPEAAASPAIATEV